MGLLTRLTVAATVTALVVCAGAAVTAAATGGLSTEEQPSLVEDYTYPNSDKVLADYGVKLISGDGHILLADCPTGPDTIGLIHVRSTDQVGAGKDGKICFRVAGSEGHLAMRIPAVYSIRGDGLTPGQGHRLRAGLTTDAGQHSDVDVNPSGTTQVGIGSNPTGAPTTLLQLDASS